MQLKQVITPSSWKSVSRPLIIAHYFKLLDECVQRNLHQLKNTIENAHVIEHLVLGVLQTRIPDCAHEQILEMTKPLKTII